MDKQERYNLAKIAFEKADKAFDLKPCTKTAEKLQDARKELNSAKASLHYKEDETKSLILSFMLEEVEKSLGFNI